MPYEIVRERQLLRIRFFGRIGSGDLRQLAREGMGLESEYAVTPHRLADLSEVVAFDTLESDFRDFAHARRQIRFPNRFKSAIVATRPLLFGLARKYQILLEHPQITVAVFKDLEAAEAWLASGTQGPPE